MTDSAAGPLPDAGRVASALGATWALLAETLQQGWARHDDGIYTLVTGVPIASLNGVWVVGEQVDADAVAAGLASVAESCVPFCLEVRPAWREQGASVAATCELAESTDIPLMVSAGPFNPGSIDRLSIRELDPSEAQVHSDVAGPAFGAPPELLARVITAEVLGRPQVRSYLGEVDREPVVTAMSVTIGDAVGIFNVATPGPHRRRGYGAAITAHAALDGRIAGAEWAWLQSTEAGYGVYERLGFTTLERWPSWISPS
ncbi:MAG: GNAT family N-acetyltransferase [Solirubrobacteraceae bacterium]